MAETSGGFYISGGRLYITPVGGVEEEIGEVSDVTITPEIEKKEALTRRFGAATVAEEITIKTDFKLAFTTETISGENLARFFYGKLKKTPTLAVGSNDPVTNLPLAEHSETKTYNVGDRVISGDALWECTQKAVSKPFSEADFKEVRKLKGFEEIGAGDLKQITASVRFEGYPLAGEQILIDIPKISLAPSGGLSLIGDDFANLVFEGTIKKTDASHFTIKRIAV